MTIGYLDGSALAAFLGPGAAGARVAELWRAFDATCTHEIVEIEVPSVVGRHVDRVAWVFTVAGLSIMRANSDVQARATDLAWLGAPVVTAVHVAAADCIGVDHFVTADEVTGSWASMRGLDVVRLPTG